MSNETSSPAPYLPPAGPRPYQEPNEPVQSPYSAPAGAVAGLPSYPPVSAAPGTSYLGTGEPPATTAQPTAPAAEMGGGSGTPTDARGTAFMPPTPKPKGTWIKVTSAAAVAAVLASLGTAALTGSFTPDQSPAAQPSAAQTQNAPSTTTQNVGSSTLDTPDWEAVAAAVKDSVVAIQVTGTSGEAEGSGVIIDAQKGYVVTNNHVISAGQQIQIALTDGTLHSATVVGADATTDLAVLKFDTVPSGLTAAALGDSSKVVVGQQVMAVGNPLGLDNTVTTGIVSAINRPVTVSESGSSSDAVVTNAIQIDAAINPGNSGGPLFNARGEVIGINSSIASMPVANQSTGSIGLGFAIPANLVHNITTQLIDTGSAQHAYLGVSLQDGTADVDGQTRAGAQVTQVNDGTPAADAGLKTGDVIVGVNGNVVTSQESLVAYVRSFAAGDSITLSVARDGKLQDIAVTLAAKPESDTSAPQQDQQQTTPGQQGQQDGQVPSLPQGQLPEDLQGLLEQYFGGGQGQQQGSR